MYRQKSGIICPPFWQCEKIAEFFLINHWTEWPIFKEIHGRMGCDTLL